MATPKLTAKHKAFADKYLLTGNASESARHAGNNPKNAHVSGYKLLRTVAVQAYLASQASRVATQEKDLQTRITEELEAMAFATVKDFITVDKDGLPQIDFSNASPDQLRAITSVSSKTTSVHGNVIEKQARFTMADKYRGLELLGKHIGMFKEAEQRVVIDVADRLLTARNRLRELSGD